jgi:transcriptional regulator with XRE-family HTH domain
LASSTIKLLLKRLRELRKAHGLTQEAFAERAGMSYKYYQALEGGRKLDPRLTTLERIAKVYGLQVHQLLNPTLSTRRKIRQT